MSKATDGSWIDAQWMIAGAPSVLHDAVALLPAKPAMADVAGFVTKLGDLRFWARSH